MRSSPSIHPTPSQRLHLPCSINASHHSLSSEFEVRTSRHVLGIPCLALSLFDFPRWCSNTLSFISISQESIKSIIAIRSIHVVINHSQQQLSGSSYRPWYRSDRWFGFWEAVSFMNPSLPPTSDFFLQKQVRRGATGLCSLPVPMTTRAVKTYPYCLASLVYL